MHLNQVVSTSTNSHHVQQQIEEGVLVACMHLIFQYLGKGK